MDVNIDPRGFPSQAEPSTPTNDPSGDELDLTPQSAAAKLWGFDTPLKNRLVELKRLRRLLLAAGEELVEAITADTGKTRFGAAAEVMHVSQTLGYLIGVARRVLAPRTVRSLFFLNKSSAVHYDPIGVVGIVSPANYPLILSLGPAVQSLAVGNATVLKPSERTPSVNALIGRLMTEWAPIEGVFRLETGGPDVARRLAGSRIGKLIYIGGAVGAKQLARIAAERLTPTLMELGGNDAMIVTADADLDRAADGAVWGAFFNAGQSCIAIERCYVASSVAAEFEAKLAERIGRLRVGRPPSKPDEEVEPDVGALYAESFARRAEELIDDAVKRGARVIARSSTMSPGDPCVAPAVALADVPADARIMREEAFAPILAVSIAANDAAAIKAADAGEFGLAASVWTKYESTGRQIAAKLRVGGVTINEALTHFAETGLPFGGVKGSGHGRLQGEEGLREFTNPKSIFAHRFGPRKELQWFPESIGWRTLLKIARAAAWRT